MKHEITTVGKLKAALEGLPEDRYIYCQTVGEDSGAWNMRGEFYGLAQGCDFALITLRHPDIRVLPDMQNEDDKLNEWLMKTVNGEDFTGYMDKKGQKIYKGSTIRFGIKEGIVKQVEDEQGKIWVVELPNGEQLGLYKHIAATNCEVI